MSIFNYSKILKNKQYYIIAEIGVNHECSIKTAKKMILQAKKNGAHAAKFQSYKAQKLASKNSKAYWDIKKEKTKSQFELFSKFDKFEKSDYEKLSKYCKKLKIDFLSTPFDLDAVDYLNPLVPLFKVSSSDITNVPLLRKISKKGKTVLLSTGASSEREIKFAIKNLQFYKKVKIVLMHCILNYPTHDRDANLLMIDHLKKKFRNHAIGYSDHTSPSKSMFNITTAYTLGANVIEKHFTLNKKKSGNDHYHSMDPYDLKTIVKNIDQIIRIKGFSINKKFIPSEIVSRKNARRGIFIKKNLKKNSKLNENNLITLRPNSGISATQWSKVLNRRVNKNLYTGHNLKWSDIK